MWITGLPASGKSTIVAALRPKLEGMGLDVEVLESDAVRLVLTPEPSYSLEERDMFYRALAFTGFRLAARGVAVIFDATAGRRAYRDFARALIPRFVEIAVECPLQVCKERDRKGTYRKGETGESATVPGLQVPYEPPLAPDLSIDTTKTKAEEAAAGIVALVKRRFL